MCPSVGYDRGQGDLNNENLVTVALFSLSLDIT